MAYDWEGKETECFRLYVEQKKSLDQVKKYWEAKGFTPSKRAFQTQFKRWGFPNKHRYAHKDEALVGRVRELWQKNTQQKEMLDILIEEGFDINERSLTRLRLKYKLMLRENQAREKREGDGSSGSRSAKKAKRKANGNIVDQIANALLEEDNTDNEDSEDQEDALQEQQEEQPATTSHPGQSESEPVDPEILQRRQERFLQLRAESDERWKTRKRRRRTRGWAGLPADAPGEPPRFPSETTIDEAKAYLSLDNALYRQIRDQFQALCEQEGVNRKTTAGPDKWTELKDSLIRESAHLQNVFQSDPLAREENGQLSSRNNSKTLSLDVICMDVTKRMRIVGNNMRMGIPEAKNILGLDPDQARSVKSALYAKLKAEHFINKLEAGEDHWNEIKQVWISESKLLTEVLAGGSSDPQYALKSKAVEVLARDVMKRIRSENLKQHPEGKKQINLGPGPGPAPPTVLPKSSSRIQEESQGNTGNPTTERPQPQSQPPPTQPILSMSADLQIDPSLLLAASDPSINSLPTQSDHNPTTYFPATTLYPSVSNLPLSIYLRLHPNSTTHLPAKPVSLGILHTGTLNELRQIIMREYPGTMIVKIEGLVVHRGQGVQARELSWDIGDDDELQAYLGHNAGGQVKFSVLVSAVGSQPF